MKSVNLESAFKTVSEELDSLWEHPESLAFRAALDRLSAIAELGSVSAAEFHGEIHALHGPHHDAEVAYVWYYIALSQQGYSVEFRDENESPPHYCGPVGDSRNESMVSELVVELGFDRVGELHEKAAAWLRAQGREPKG
jgi:hypothetical protein